MIEATLFFTGSIFITRITSPSLRHPGSHGYYRYFAWECIWGLFMINVPRWFVNPFDWYQIISWILLFTLLIPLFTGVTLLRKAGKPTDTLEATTQLVRNGIFCYIRHPLYASLLYFAWGLFFKSPSLLGGFIAVVASAFLFTTARADERECLVKFGNEYAIYIKQTKAFIPFVF